MQIEEVINMIYTFWEGKMPEYIKACMNTWKKDYIVLNYDNLSKYTDIPNIDKLKRFTLPQIADVVRVHVLRDNGGYWLDTDTIMITDKLPKENMIGFPDTRGNTIGFLHTEPNTDMFTQWAKYQDSIVASNVNNSLWSIMGNSFTDDYVKEHNEITIADVTNCWAETYMIKDDIARRFKYQKFYFETNYHLSDLRPTNMLMLHNSWTPMSYKEHNYLDYDCTLTNILKEV